MNATAAAFRGGLSRGRIELRQTLTNLQDLWGYLFPAALVLAVLVFMRGMTVGPTGFSLGSMTLPSVLGMNIAFGGLVMLASALIVEREDGTLLRVKAVPQGMTGYLVGKIVQVSGMILIGMAIVLIPGAFLFDGLDLSSVGSWLTFVWVVALGLVATMPLGAMIGSLFSNPKNIGLVMLPMMGLIGISGIFYPITHFPGWLQALAQIFPLYWLGLGMRSALLPDAMASVEVGDSWRHLETLGVLGLWAVAGLVVAPMVLRRMARRESGSSVAERREKAIQRRT